MIERPLTDEALRRALDHIYDFILVRNGDEDVAGATRILMDGLGITPENAATIGEWCDEIAPDQAAGVLLGVVIGLIAADYDHAA